ncbi:hypothetical protein BDR26DRAFT_92204 [Obelidium mucronatum]|nr:hypothetical protein BDR26DRAFT_92204 [Obelidium mucronatum]
MTGLMTFAMFLVQQITQDVASIKIPMNGFLFTECKQVYREFPGLAASLRDAFQVIRETWVFHSDSPVVLLMDEFGLTGWDELRDGMNGLVLVNPLLETCGKVKILSNSDRAIFDKQMNQLKKERSTRKDFVVFCIECVETSIPFHILNHVIKFYADKGFRYWIPKSTDLSLVSDIVATPPMFVTTDILELATVPAAMACQQIAEEISVDCFGEGNRDLEIGQDHWNVLLRALKESSDLWTDTDFTSALRASSSQTFSSNLYKRIKFPESPRVVNPVEEQEAVLAVLKKLSSTESVPILFAEEKIGIQHKCIGVAINPPRQAMLGNLVRKVLWELKGRDLLAAVRYNNDLGSDTEELAAPFVKMLSLFKAMLDPNLATASTVWVYSQLEVDTRVQVMDALKMLVNGLQKDAISVWCATKLAFIPKDGTEGIPNDLIWALTEERAEKLYIFVSDGHPCLEEAVLHSFVKHLGFSSGLCVMVEALVSAQRNIQRNNADGLRLPIPVRIVEEVKSASRSMLMTLIRNESVVLDGVKSKSNSTGELQYLTVLADYVTKSAEFLLIAHEGFIDAMKSHLDSGYIPITAIEEYMVEFFGKQTNAVQGLSNVSKLFGAMHQLFQNEDFMNHPELRYALCCLAFTLRKCLRRCAYLELDQTITTMSTQILLDSDQVAVCLETATTQTTLQEIFCLSSLQLAPIFHREQRIKLKENEESNAQQRQQAPVPKVSNANIEFKKGIMVANSYIYIYPILVDLIFNSCLSSGLFFSSRMDSLAFQAASTAILVSFPFIGALMNSFGRAMSFYFYQLCLPVMVVAVSHRLAASITVLLVVSILVGLSIYLFVSKYWVLLVMGGVHAILFGIYMIMYAILVAFRDLSVPFYSSPGPLVCVQSIGLLMLSPLISRFVFNDTSHGIIVWGIYIVNLTLVVAFMVFRYTKIVAEFLDWPNSVRITSKESILRSFEGIVMKPPVLEMGETAEELDQRKRLWERNASEWFSSQLNKALQNLMPGACEPVKERLRQWKWERPLMAWFMQRNSIDPSTVKVFSSEWDSLAKQAVGALARKYQVDKLHRGPLLLQLEAPAIVFGFLYFIVIFVDKFAVLCATGRIGDASESDVNVAIAFATIYLLLAAGFLELTITSVSEQVNKFSYKPVSTVEDPRELIAQYQAFTDRVYRDGVKEFALRVLTVLIFVSVFVGIYLHLYSAPLVIAWKYFIDCFCLTGLLVGLLNKMFVSANEHLLNKFLAIAIVVGVAISAALIRVTGDISYSLLATGLGCWGFAVSCLTVRQFERMRSPYYDISIAPSLRSSGQRAIGFSSNSFTESQLNAFSVKLMSEKVDYTLISPFSPLGHGCLKLLKAAIVSASRPDLQSSTIHEMIFIINTSIEKYSNGAVTIVETPGSLEAGGVMYSAIAATSSSPSTVELCIFMPSMPGLNEADKEKIICDALIHEVAEALGLSHTRACVMELLVASCFSTSFVLPSRIQRELQLLTDVHRDRVISNIEREITKACCLGIDIDRFWGGEYFSERERKFLIQSAKQWSDLVAGGAQGLDGWIVSCDVPPLMDKTLASWNGLSLTLVAMFEHFLLQTYVANAISIHTQSIGTSKTLPKPMLKPTVKRSLCGRISECISTHLAVGYFALICDTSFAREVAKLPGISRIPMSLLFLLNQVIFDHLNRHLLFNRNKHTLNFQRRAQGGISRIHSFQNSRRSHVTTIAGTEAPITTTIVPQSHATVQTQCALEDIKERWMHLELRRFLGVKSHDLKLSDLENPFEVALVRESASGTLQILHEHILDPKGKVQAMHTYSYQGGVAIRRFVFDGIPDNSQTCPQLSKETHLFFQNGPLAGLVQYADLMRTNKQSKQKMVITVEFEYRLPLTGKIPSRGIFRRSGLPNWGMVIDYAPYSDFRSPLQPLSVRYWDDFSGTVVTTITKFDYSHPKHVVMKTILEGDPLSKSFNSLDEESPTPIEILEDHFGVMNLLPCKSIFDSCELLTKNLKARYRRNFTPLKWPLLELRSIEYFESPYSTRHQRDILWASWRAGEIPGVLARILDQNILRSESTLRKYWMYRFMGRTNQAVQFLEDNRELFNNVLYVADKPATRTRLQIRFSDLLIMGNGGDSEMISSFEQSSASVAAEVNESREGILEAICLDSGTWPTGGGGVGSCRRDLVDSLNRVRWTAIAEIAVMELEHKDYQIEKNIRSITYLPLFDNDFGNPMENFYKTTLFAELRDRSIKTTDEVVVTQFLPLVTQLVDACMTGNLDSRRIQQDEQMVVGLYQYFRVYDWKLSWDHPLTQKTWVRLMLNKAKELEQNGTLLGQESPTLAHISMLFTLIVRLLLILSKEIPNIPVVHVSHHGTQSLIAVISKIIHGSSVIIWDHGMLWRERLFALCRDGMPPFTQIGFIGFTRLCTRLVYHRSDYVTPCTNVQNRMWASHLGGGKYLNEAERCALMSKCSAVLNGMNLKRFTIKRELARKTPTAVMLSHISPVKDVMNAIQAAFYIVHEFKLTSYELHVYGSPNMDMDYTLACTAAIKDLNLESNVTLKGLGNPALVLPTGWIFVNSSITEGLPLAIGEASLCGLPVVCTNVGGSLEVISDLKTGALYGAIVPPSRSRQLALAQLKVLGMTDGLDSFVDPSRSDSPMVSVQDLIASPEALETRIMDPEIGKLREQLGEMFSKKTQSVFSIARYCREHEQVLWLGALYARLKIPGLSHSEESSVKYYDATESLPESADLSLYHECFY